MRPLVGSLLVAALLAGGCGSSSSGSSSGPGDSSGVRRASALENCLTGSGYRVKQTGALKTDLPTLKLSSLLSSDYGASVLDAAAQESPALPQLRLFVFSSAERARPFADQLRIDAHRFFAAMRAAPSKNHPQALVGTREPCRRRSQSRRSPRRAARTSDKQLQPGQTHVATGGFGRVIRVESG